MTDLRKGTLFAPLFYPWAAPKKPILYRVKIFYLLENLFVGKWLIEFLISLEIIAVFLIWSYSLVISRQSPGTVNYLKIFHTGYFYSNLSVIALSEIQSGHFKIFSINWEQIAVKYRYCKFHFKCLAFLNSWKVHQQRTLGTVRVVKDVE